MESGKLIGFVGLDELGLQMASSLLRHGYSLQAFEVNFLSFFFLSFLQIGSTDTDTDTGHDTYTDTPTQLII